MNRFNLAKFIISMTFIALVGLIVGSLVFGDSVSYSLGINGMTETRCINGMQFVVGQSGSVQQILGANGGGVSCQ